MSASSSSGKTSAVYTLRELTYDSSLENWE